MSAFSHACNGDDISAARPGNGALLGSNWVLDGEAHACKDISGFTMKKGVFGPFRGFKGRKGRDVFLNV
jgi:hypothetical protein